MTQDNLDFKDASILMNIEAKETKFLSSPCLCVFMTQGQLEAIQVALRIADRMQRGEVSEGMRYVCETALYEKNDWPCDHAMKGYRLMSTQLIKECSDD